MIKIVGDSSLDTRAQDEQLLPVIKVPFTINLDDSTWVDTRDVDLDGFVTAMKASQQFQSACPSPNDFLEAYKGKDDVFCITITSKLSGSHNSAELARTLSLEEGPDQGEVVVLDSKSASSGPYLIYRKISEMIDQGSSFQEIKQVMPDFIDQMNTMFISKSLENLRKAGRLSNIKAMIVKALNIVPIMGAVDGVIEMIDKARGEKRAFETLMNKMEEFAGDLSGRIVAISHANYESKALELKNMIEQRFKAREVVILRTQALNTLYVDEQGIIISF